MANSSLTLQYFDAKGRAEISRLILAIAGKEYEDVRFSDDDWPKYKPQMPFGQVPTLEVDGKKFGQSIAISTFLAREFGLYGDTNLDGLKIDQIVHLVNDFINVVADVFDMSEGPEKEKVLTATKQEKGPKLLGQLERLLKENGTGYFVGSKLSLADLVVFDILTGFIRNYMDFPQDGSYPLLEKFHTFILANDKIGPYMSLRPKTEF